MTRRKWPLVVSLVVASWTAPSADVLPRFLAGSVFNDDISSAPVHPDSATMIAATSDFGNSRLQIDFSFHVVNAADGAPTRTIVEHAASGYYSPDCEPPGTAMPVPAGSAIEGETGLTCDNTSNDCHLLVVQGSSLYEAYSATAPNGSQLETLCLAVWQLDAEYPEELRGDHCTSADAAGFPIAPLLFNADEIAAQLAIDSAGGTDLGHAIRFILPNERMANDDLPGAVGGRLYVRPGTHAGSPSGTPAMIPYAARLRLHPGFDDSNYPPAAKVLLNTFKRYGIVLADGGIVALTGESDLYTTTKWADLSIDAQVFYETTNATDVHLSDFEVIDTGPRIAETWDCVRTTVTPGLFADGFDSGATAAWSSTAP